MNRDALELRYADTAKKDHDRKVSPTRMFGGIGCSKRITSLMENIMRISAIKSIRGLTLWAAVLTGATVFTLALAVAEQPKKAPITEDDVKAAQQAWCDALVKIGKV